MQLEVRASAIRGGFRAFVVVVLEHQPKGKYELL